MSYVILYESIRNIAERSKFSSGSTPMCNLVFIDCEIGAWISFLFDGESLKSIPIFRNSCDSSYVLTDFNWFSLAIINRVNAAVNAIVTASTRGIGTSRCFPFLIYIR